MKFSKILTTAMMSAVLVASSSALATETSWWTMNFDGLAIEEGGTLTNALNAAYATDQNGWWTSEEGDLSELVDNKLKLNTQGTDLTWTPNADNDPTAITYIDADVTFVGSDAAPTVTETDVHTAVYLKNLADETTGEVTNSVLCAWGTTRTDSTPKWYDLTGVEIKEKDENDNPISYGLRIMLDGENLTFYIDDVELTSTETIFSAKEGSSGSVDSVSFRGTGYVDNFAASQEVKESAGTATIVASALLNDGTIDETLYMWCDSTVLVESINLDETTPQAIRSLIPAVLDMAGGDFVEGGALSAMGVSINDGAERLIEYNEGFPADDELFSFEYGEYVSVYVDPAALSNGDSVSVVFYYGTHTSTDPVPEQLDPPSVKVATTETSVTLTWDAVANATGYDVTINGTTTTVTETTFTASNLTASTEYAYSVVAKGDGESYTDSAAASGTATTATPAQPDPEPVQLDAPVVTVTTTADSVTLTWDAVANATGYDVTFNGTTTTVTDTTFTASDLTASTEYAYSVVAKGDGESYTDSAAASGTATTALGPIKISAITGPVEVDGEVVVTVTVVSATEGGKIKAGVNYWAVVSDTLGGEEKALEPVTVDADTDSLEITVPATGDSLFIKVKADTAAAE